MKLSLTQVFFALALAMTSFLPTEKAQAIESSEANQVFSQTLNSALQAPTSSGSNSNSQLLQHGGGYHPSPEGYFYDWGRGNDGWGYCYRFANEGFVLDQGRPHPNHLCDAYHPSYFDWARGNDGWGYCYQFAKGLVLNQGRPMPQSECERFSPSIYRWDRGVDGYVYCFQFSRSGLVLNQGRPVPEFYCRRN